MVGGYFSKEIIMDIKGLSIKELMNMDLDTLNKLNESELRDITNRMVKVSNQRISRLQHQDIESPALMSLKGKKFSTKMPKSFSPQQRISRLKETIASTKTFLGHKTSTIKGVREMESKMKETMSTKYDVELTSEQLRQTIKVMNRLKRDGKIGGRGSVSSAKMFELLSKRVSNNGRLKVNKDYKTFSKWSDMLYKIEQGASIDINPIDDETEEITID